VKAPAVSEWAIGLKEAAGGFGESKSRRRVAQPADAFGWGPQGCWFKNAALARMEADDLSEEAAPAA
jgi:hypothetical protein